MRRTFSLLAIGCVLAWATGAHAQSDFALRDGDRVFFLGDSNTFICGFPQVTEIYTLLRFPLRNVTFTNVGVGGDTATGGAHRIGAGVIAEGAKAVVVTYGINDFFNCYVQ